MKASLYINYTTRSLVRGGQRTILAIFCVAVGVMAIVALQLAGFMLHSSFIGNIRDTNGGDIAISGQFQDNDLTFFDNLKHKGTISNYTAIINSNGSLSPTGSRSQSIRVQVVNPQSFPVVTPPAFVTPSNGSLAQLLTNNQVVVTQTFLDTYKKKIGDSLTVYIKQRSGSGQTLHVKLAGVVANSGIFTQAGSALLISAQDYQASENQTAASTLYDTVDIATTSQHQTDTAVKVISKQFPLASIQTVADAITSVQTQLDYINKFLEIAGLLALLIGGVGIVNTMRVLLSRRKTEIAMLKTSGYRRSDLYMLFGLEAGLLGLIGGIVGAISAIGVSYLVRNLLQNLGMSIQFTLNPWIIGSGVLTGLSTALIFGLMPIIQAANVRPLNVIRDLNENKGIGSKALTILLLALLSILFCIMAIVILNNDVQLGIEAVYGTFAFLLVLSAFFSLIVLIISKLPVPEQVDLKYLVLLLISAIVTVVTFLVQPLFGILMGVVTLLGIAASVMPRTWKVSTKMALRNIGRQRTRTTMTIVALFIGIFTIGLVLILGQDLQNVVSNAFISKMTYNIVVITTGNESSTLQAKQNTIPGRSKTFSDVYTPVTPALINGQSVQQKLPTGPLRQQALSQLSSVEGYDLTHTKTPAFIVKGRNLTASDANANTILINHDLNVLLNLNVGDTITLNSADNSSTVTETIVGIYDSTPSSGTQHIGSLLASENTVKALSSSRTGVSTITYLKIDNAQVTNALNTIGKIVPNATIQNLSDISTYIEQQLNSMMAVLISIASLSLFAGVIIIANTVALAMLERRRELGILKSVGYTSKHVLSEVMIENGIVGSVGAFIAMVVIAIALTLLGKLLFNIALDVQPAIALSLVGGSAMLAIITAALVAWGAVRVRPLEVLRYE